MIQYVFCYELLRNKSISSEYKTLKRVSRNVAESDKTELLFALLPARAE